MSFEELLAQSVADAVRQAQAPLIARLDALERLLTAQGGERQNDLLTLEQVAARLRVSKRTVLRYVEKGQLHAPTGAGHARRWRVRDLSHFGEVIA